jgi:hypothetical protein
MTAPHPSIFGEPGDDDAARPDPARAFPTREDRRAAFAAWQAAGLPRPSPVGLTSACLRALLTKREDAKR